MTKIVRYHKGNKIAHIVMDRPQKLNALSPEMSIALQEALIAAEKDEEVNIVILSSSGSSFCAGGDIETMQSKKGSENILKWMEESSKLIKVMRDMNKFIIAAINGHAAGAGVSLGLASDFIIADVSTRFTFSFAKIGLIPDLGLFKLVSERVPINIAKEWIAFASVITAEEALSKGLINRLAKGDVVDEAIHFSENLLDKPFFTQKFTKKILNKIDTMDLGETIYQENIIQTILLQTENHKEGVSAFFEKRTPTFK